ncbi:ZZ-type zinc finger-containing protein 3 [Mortierella alpina]|nr:ZZ-type zinc finger-containing protein 3 [Mortierella alpina]
MSLLDSEAGTAGAAAAPADATPAISAPLEPPLDQSAPPGIALDASSDVSKLEPISPQPVTAPVQPSPPPPQVQEQPSPSHSTPPAQPEPSTSAIGNGSMTPHVPSSLATSALDRGPLGLAPDEEDWVKDRMEYALYDFQVLALAIKRYKWQLSQVPKDISRLQSLKEKHMSDPFEFLRQVKHREFRYPEGQRTLPAPMIEWSKYQFPPANPVVPTKPQTATFLHSVSHTTGHDRNGSKVVSLTSNSRSRAGSPSYERMQTVKDTARQLGIHVTQIHQYHHHHHRSTSQHSIQDSGPPSARIETNGVEANDVKGIFRIASQEAGQMERAYSQSPGVGGASNGMTGVIYDSQLPGHRARSATIPEGSTAQMGATHYNSMPVQQPPSYRQPSQEGQSAEFSNGAHVADRVIDHSAGYTIQHHGVQTTNSNISNSNNITYTHMSGSVDIKPSAATAGMKGKGYAREGSGAREETKPPLYNIPWSDEEQRLLEKLLDEYPDEPVAAQRFQKISAAMGTRTPKQVASRVQKYFIKLVKAGLEAPGRMNYSLETSKPKSKAAATAGGSSTAKGKKRKDGPVGSDGGASKSKAGRPRKKDIVGGAETGGSGSGSGSGAAAMKKQRPKSLLGSGFGRTSGTQYLQYASAPTVFMSDEDDEDSVQDMLAMSTNGNTPGTATPGNGVAAHMGFYCDSCGVDPILGVRHSCIDCEEFGGTDLCGPCYNMGTYQSEHHVLSHRFQSIETADVPVYSHSNGARPPSVGPSGTSSVYFS